MANGKVETFGEAVGILVQVAHLAQSKGILSISEAAIVAQALEQVDAFKAQVEKRTAATEQQQETADVAQG